MKLTDEKVAKALGWVEVRERRTAHGRARLSGFDGKSLGKTPYNVPAFTTSLDSITREIEARGLWWAIDWPVKSSPNALGRAWVEDEEKGGTCAAEALCAALLTYLKKEKP